MDTFRPTATFEMLHKRAKLLHRVRHFFESRGFLEVETPILSVDTVVDRHLDPMFLTLNGKRFFLQTSPEFAMKRLLAAGSGPIFQVGKVFRHDEYGELHNPEFTMLEYYRPGDDLITGMNFLDEFQDFILHRGAAERKTYREVFLEILGLDPFQETENSLAEYVKKEGISAPEYYFTSNFSVNVTKDDWLDLILTERIQPKLGIHAPLILYHYPASQAALAQTVGEVAERFELYVNGLEIGNGYHELCNAHVLRQRNKIVNALRRLDGKEILPEKSRLLQAMDHGLPPCAGTAIGFDRLFMVTEGAKTLQEVIAFPFDRA
ncbi:MAG: EF-P lysine aminoacylase EpmA [Planctomycetia bacterium]|nr:EF-P lysine aminoacylase EpmA [Planctomycetia bacterium]